MTLRSARFLKYGDIEIGRTSAVTSPLGCHCWLVQQCLKKNNASKPAVALEYVTVFRALRTSPALRSYRFESETNRFDTLLYSGGVATMQGSTASGQDSHEILIEVRGERDPATETQDHILYRSTKCFS